MFANWRFQRALRKIAAHQASQLRDYAGEPWPDRSALIASVPFLALDFELDGLGADAHALQVGWVAFSPAVIPLGAAEAHDIQSDRILDDAAVAVHGIGEDRARKGRAIGTVFDDLIAALKGRILIAHGASIECDVMRRVSRQLFGIALPVRSICTLALEQHLHPQLPGSGPYRLAATRARYGLPAYGQHDALSDALGAAELFLAQLAHMPDDTTLGALEDLRVHH